ncbi:MAG: hypothetical protein EPN84_07285 [Legionella sp.]|nr:MAG: hypothetical protein EPN84_07285 [Legionella sp.]
MTIFLMVVKELIRRKIDKRMDGLKAQITGWTAPANNTELSQLQLNILTGIQSELNRVGETNDDSKNIDEIIDKLKETRTAVEAARVSKNYKEQGETIDCLNELLIAVPKFLDKMRKFMHERTKQGEIIPNTDKGFTLLNRGFNLTPANVLYYHMLYFLGDDIFFPEDGNGAIRQAKEGLLRDKLKRLNTLVTADASLDNQNKEVLEVIDIMQTGNSRLVDKKPKRGIFGYIPDVYGINVVSTVAKLVSASEGRLLEQLKNTKKNLSYINPINFNRLVISPISEQGFKVKAEESKASASTSDTRSAATSSDDDRRSDDEEERSGEQTPPPPPPTDVVEQTQAVDEDALSTSP